MPKRFNFDSLLFDKNGEEITLREFCNLGSDPKYFKLMDHTGEYVVYTTWVGVDTAHPMLVKNPAFRYQRWEPNNPPLIIKSLVFNQDLDLVAADMYPNAKKAREGHEQLVSEYKNRY